MGDWGYEVGGVWVCVRRKAGGRTVMMCDDLASLEDVKDDCTFGDLLMACCIHTQ